MAHGKVAAYDHDVVVQILSGGDCAHARIALRECCCRPRRAAKAESAAEGYALSRLLEPLAPSADTNAAARRGDGGRPAENLKDKTPLEPTPIAGFEAGKHPLALAAEVDQRQGLAPKARAAKGCLKDRPARKLRFSKMHPLGTLYDGRLACSGMLLA